MDKNLSTPSFSHTVSNTPGDKSEIGNKFFGTQNSTMSFGGNDLDNVSNNKEWMIDPNGEKDATSINKEKERGNYGIKNPIIEEDYPHKSDTNSDFYKQKLEDEKKRYETLLSEEKEKYKRKEQDLNKYIEELKSRHKEELKSNEEKNRAIIDSLTEDNKKLRNEIDKEVQNEKERLSILHKSDLENQENIFKKNLENQKKFFEEQNETLKKQLQQQIEFNKLANKVEISSKQIDEILQKFYQEKDQNIENDKLALEKREKNINEFEEKLKETEKKLNAERESVLNMRKDFEYREMEKRKELQEERSRIDKEIVRLQELQNSLKLLEFNAKEKYEKDKLEINQKHSDMKIEIETLKNDFYQKLNDLEYSKKIFEEEKKFFEKYKDEAIKNIELKKVNLEERKKQFYEEEREIKGRVKVLQEKEYYLREKFEEFERVKAEIEEAEKKTEKDRRELMIAAKRLEEGIRTLDDKTKIFETKKEDIIKKFQEIENDKAIVNSEKLKIEQSRAELRLRLQSVDMMRIKYVSGGVSNMSLPLPLLSDYKSSVYEAPFQSNPNFTANNYRNMNSNILNNYMDNKISQINSNFNNPNDLRQSKAISSHSVRKSFNANDYMQTLKMKLGDKEKEPQHILNSNFNAFIQQEKEYLRSSNELFENSIKKDYEKLSQQYLNNQKINPSDISQNIPELEKNDNDYFTQIKEESSKVASSNYKKDPSPNPYEKKVHSGDFLDKKVHSIENKPVKKSAFDDFDEIEDTEVKIGNIGKPQVDNKYDDEFE